MRRSFATIVVLVLGCGRSAPRKPAASAPEPVAPPVVAAPTPADTTPKPVTLPVVPDTALKTTLPKRPDRPAQRCVLDFENTPETRAQSIRDPISQKYTTYIGGGVVGICRGQAIRIIADSAESYEQNKLHYLIGRVKYREDRVSLDADRITYFQGEERLLAEGNVVATMKDSSSMTGPRAEYFRAVRPLRTASRIVATARPTLRLYETDSVGRRQKEPVVLVADNIVGEGETLFVAHGTVTLDRTDLRARGDSAILDNVRQFSRLMKQPVVESKGSQPFTLNGRVIDIFGQSKRVDRVLATDSAKAVSKDLTLTAQNLDMRVIDNRLQRVYAYGSGLAQAVTVDRKIVAESLDVRMPNQRLRSLFADRQAYAESDPDSNKVKSKERDWLRGAVIFARFDSLMKDTTAQPRILDLTATGSASSFYHVPANNGDKTKPGVNYVRGRKIAVDFNDKEVNLVTVSDSVSGVYLEATPPDTTPPSKNGKSKQATRGRPAAALPGRGRRPPSR